MGDDKSKQRGMMDGTSEDKNRTRTKELRTN